MLPVSWPLLSYDVAYYWRGAAGVIADGDFIAHDGDGQRADGGGLDVQHFAGGGVLDFLALVVDGEGLAHAEAGGGAGVDGDAGAVDVGNYRVQIVFAAFGAAGEAQRS